MLFILRLLSKHLFEMPSCKSLLCKYWRLLNTCICYGHNGKDKKDFYQQHRQILSLKMILTEVSNVMILLQLISFLQEVTGVLSGTWPERKLAYKIRRKLEYKIGSGLIKKQLFKTLYFCTNTADGFVCMVSELWRYFTSY